MESGVTGGAGLRGAADADGAVDFSSGLSCATAEDEAIRTAVIVKAANDARRHDR